MAISFVGSSPVTTTSNGADVTVNFTSIVTTAGATATILQDDLVVAVFGSSRSIDLAMQTLSSGWTEATEIYSGGTQPTNLAVYHKVMGATPDTSFVADGGASGAEACAVVLFVFRGVDTTTPLDVAVVTATGANTTNYDAPSITPSTAGAWIMVAGAGVSPIGAAYTLPADLSATTNHFRSDNRTETADLALAAGIKTDWVSGAFNPTTISGGVSNTGDSWAAVTLALRPVVTSQALTPSLHTNSQTFYGPTVSAIYALTPSLYSSSQTFHAPTATRGAVNLAPSLFTNSQTFYAPTVASGTTALQPGLFTNSQSFYGPTVGAGAVALSPALLTNTQTFHGPAITVGGVSLSPALLTNTQTFHAPTVSQGAAPQELTPGVYTNGQTFYAATISTSYGLSPSLVSNSQTLYAPTVSASYGLLPSLLVNSSVFYAALLENAASPAEIIASAKMTRRLRESRRRYRDRTGVWR
jgi:hypothetical protein